MNKEIINRTITGICFAGIILGTLVILPPFCFSLLLAVIASIIALVELPRLAALYSYCYWALLVGYLILPFFSMAFLNYYPCGHKYLIVLFLVAFSHDTAALLAGKLFGKHRLAPTISPGKTWEGFVGGFLGIFGLLLVCHHYSLISYSYSILFPLSGALATAATLGDLFESWLKRRAHIKDASSILPGHGGFLDRFDSIIFLSVMLSCVFIFKYFLYE